MHEGKVDSHRREEGSGLGCGIIVAALAFDDDSFMTGQHGSNSFGGRVQFSFFLSPQQLAW